MQRPPSPRSATSWADGGRLAWPPALVACLCALAVMGAGCSATADRAPGSLRSTTTASSEPGALHAEVEPAYGYQFVTAAVAAATSRVDLVVYELSDTSVERSLAAAAARGVTVEVLLDRHLEEASNEAAYRYLAAHGVGVRWGPGDTTVHQKTLCTDGGACFVMTGNLTPQYYGDTRDDTVEDTDPADVSAIETTFSADFSGAPLRTGAPGADLLWSPGSEPALVGLIDAATSTLLVESEEMASPAILSALERAARRGVDVELSMTARSEWTGAFDELVAAGVKVSTDALDAPLYIHAKAVVADGRRAFVGSENFSSASLDHNRELGLLTDDAAVVRPLAGQISADFAGATPWTG